MRDQIPKNWREVKLGEILGPKGYIRGPFGSSLRRGELLTEGIPVYEQHNAIQDNRIFRFYINESKFNELQRFAVKPNDLVISCSGSLGKVTIIRDGNPKGIISQALLILRPDTSRAFPKYLYYFLTSAAGFRAMTSRSTGSAMVNIAKREIIEDIELLAPPVPGQKRIALILSAFDDKIEMNNKIAKTLEEMAQATFKEWFVDFKFPGHEKVKFVDSELGKIPEGWRVKNLKNIVALVSERYTGDNEKDRIPYLPIDLIQPKTLLLKETAPVKQAKSSLIKFLENDILFGAMRPYFFKVSVAPFAGLSRTTCFVLRPKEKYLFGYATFSVFRQETVDYATNLSQGSTIPYARWEGALADMKLIEPSLEVLHMFNTISLPTVEKIKDLFFENQKLAEMRDLLLPKLMKGQIRV